MWVCLCFKLNEERLRAILARDGLESVIDKSKKAGCGSCIKTIVDLRNLETQEE